MLLLMLHLVCASVVYVGITSHREALLLQAGVKVITTLAHYSDVRACEALLVHLRSLKDDLPSIVYV